ncbi:hypothetical protein SAY86_031309 [Trapa natans]|uniref:Uncharacterized protein n=1 Tax=Trapa natans TaxID=22666 RepID=A0AAN7M6F9_TRANT|nr:hypothetical protein SAY86_031309 [Trapa natans]
MVPPTTEQILRQPETFSSDLNSRAEDRSKQPPGSKEFRGLSRAHAHDHCNQVAGDYTGKTTFYSEVMLPSAFLGVLFVRGGEDGDFNEASPALRDRTPSQIL